MLRHLYFYSGKEQLGSLQATMFISVTHNNLETFGEYCSEPIVAKCDSIFKQIIENTMTDNKEKRDRNL